ncbi:MAG: CNP1-like family protein [Gammaproteobacteria bacterium]|nr:CNP1-like family protein [Gammaproteobacteria bacterium]
MNTCLKISFLGIFQIFRILMVSGILLLSFFSTVAFADVWDKLGSHAEEYQENEGIEDYVWKETESNLPEYPQESDLLEVAGPPAYRNYQYLIDEKNLNVGKDGVVRYSLVIRSPGGADNVMFDGIHCIQNQIKNYAYGSTDMDGNKKFTLKQTTEWKSFRPSGVTAYGKIFATNYFCNHDGIVLTRHEIIQNMKYGKGPVDGLYN